MRSMIASHRGGENEAIPTQHQISPHCLMISGGYDVELELKARGSLVGEKTYTPMVDVNSTEDLALGLKQFWVS